MEMNKFSMLYERLCFAFDKEVKKGQVLVYYDYLGNLTSEAFAYAVDKAILYSTFFPKISELIDYSREYKEAVPPDRQLEANEKIPTKEEAIEILKNIMKGKEVI